MGGGGAVCTVFLPQDGGKGRAAPTEEGRARLPLPLPPSLALACLAEDGVLQALAEVPSWLFLALEW